MLLLALLMVEFGLVEEAFGKLAAEVGSADEEASKYPWLGW